MTLTGEKALAASVTLLTLRLLVSLVVAQASGDPKAGRMKYGFLCVPRHGTKGQGDGPAAASLPVNPRDHSNGNYRSALTDQSLFDLIKKGGGRMGKHPVMPAWGRQVSDEEIWNLIASIWNLAVPPYQALRNPENSLA